MQRVGNDRASEEQTAAFLKLVNDPANWPVYAHCKGGRHRTGQMTALYRITKDGWTAVESYREMKRYDSEDSLFYQRALRSADAGNDDRAIRVAAMK